jgi:mannose-6-phosphate isomerase-like protein (cupin superfamily)
MKNLRTLIIILITCAATINGYSQETKTQNKMKIVNVKDAKIKETPHKVDVRPLYNYENAQVMHITLQPGESLKPHLTPVDVFFYILEGSPHVMVGEENIQVNKDNLVESPKDIVHCLSNKTDKVARILVVKSPRPTTKSKFL